MDRSLLAGRRKKRVVAGNGESMADNHWSTPPIRPSEKVLVISRESTMAALWEETTMVMTDLDMECEAMATH